jgi:hypothetical protein
VVERPLSAIITSVTEQQPWPCTQYVLYETLTEFPENLSEENLPHE